MIVVRTCPKCGGDLRESVLCSYPPIPKVECPKCGYSWQGERQEVVRVPFNPQEFNYIESSDDSEITPLNTIDNQCNTCPTNVYNGGAAGAILAALMECYEGGK